ncbi:gamma-glutamylcyclotransferase [Acidisoma cellulosilytica]|uniref:glutathione-specific gamma-glutamylcyclotransferase n=1 Tax=Acidisoma cellulosilyticum TaxID=2802395 RepID=A0A964E2M2_9PROT|nr:gamma-glutamylcyclotransferase [Acidisoma cellulosilyticum]MCB8879765.1 gamma-glutamylcyclotransferase [Acidisoma cellulosilyticum]
MSDLEPPDDAETGSLPALEAPEDQLISITRETLSDGSILARIIAEAPVDMKFMSETELAASQAKFMAAHPAGEDLWLFGYGSLMWNPVIDFAERRVATIYGFHRAYCIWLLLGRGSPAHPGLMLALDRGGSCAGLAYRIPAHLLEHEMPLLWRREMAGYTYRAQWVTAHSADGPVRALTFVVDRRSPRYASKLSDDEIASRVATASGILGSCTSYLKDTLETLQSLGLKDQRLSRIATLVAARKAQRASVPVEG